VVPVTKKTVNSLAVQYLTQGNFMANRTSTLYIRVTKNGRNSFCKPVYLSKGRLKPQYAVVEGEPEHHREGVYSVAGKNRVTVQGMIHDVADEKSGREHKSQQHAHAMRFPVVMFDEIRSHAERNCA
jgi:hypothetical protein